MLRKSANIWYLKLFFIVGWPRAFGLSIIESKSMMNSLISLFGESSSIVGVGVDRKHVSSISAMQRASVHPVGFTVFSPPAVKGIGIQIESALSITSSASFDHLVRKLLFHLLELCNVWPNSLGFDCFGVDPRHKLTWFSSA